MNKNFYMLNRQRLVNSISDDKCIMVFSSGYEINRSADENYEFQVNNNFYYLTGITQPNVFLIIIKDNERHMEILYIDEYDEMYEKWMGHRLTKKEASQISGIYMSNIDYVSNFISDVDSYMLDYKEVYLDLETKQNKNHNSFGLSFKEYLLEKHKDINVNDAYQDIIFLRMAKQNCEIRAIKRAIETTRLGIESLMKNAKSGIYEYQLEAYFDFEIKKNGATGYAFKTIAGSGVNGAVLHYGANNSLIEDNSLILFDLGAQYNLYNADITRTFPVSGKFSDRQKVIYDIVLRGQDLIISKVRPGRTLNELNDILKEYYIKELKKINLIKEDKELINYYFHGVSHHLGLDTHDACVRSTPLKEGAVITVEPGLYIEEEKIGIRIENDVLVTSDGCIDLASDIIKTIEDIENFMKK